MLRMAATIHFDVPHEAARQRLDVFLLAACNQAADPLERMSRMQLQRLIEAGAVQVDGAPARPARRLRGGERLRLCRPAPQPSALRPEPMPLVICYEDPHLLVVDKPADLVVHPGAGTHAPTLVHGLLGLGGSLSSLGGNLRPGIVHRLDRHTTGLILVAKTDAAHARLADQLAWRQLRKLYLGLVHGRPTPAQARILTAYGRHPVHRARFTSRAGSRRAQTCYRVLATASGLSLLRLRLDTGRTHQIRVHLSERGQPLLGDRTYGGCNWQRLPPDCRAAAQALPGQALHAEALSFWHPIWPERPVHVHAPLPARMQALLAAAGLPLPLPAGMVGLGPEDGGAKAALPRIWPREGDLPCLD